MKRPPFLLLILLIPLLAFAGQVLFSRFEPFHYGMFFPYLALKMSVFFCFFLCGLYWVLIRKWKQNTIAIFMAFFLGLVVWFAVVRAPLVELGGAFLAFALLCSFFQKDNVWGICGSLFATGVGAAGLLLFVFFSPWMGMTVFLITQVLYEMFWEGRGQGKEIDKDRFWQAYRVAREAMKI